MLQSKEIVLGIRKWIYSTYERPLSQTTPKGHKPASFQTIRVLDAAIYVRNARENATPRMLENREMGTALAPFPFVDVDDASEPELVRLPVVPLPLPEWVGADVEDGTTPVTVLISVNRSVLWNVLQLELLGMRGV